MIRRGWTRGWGSGARDQGRRIGTGDTAGIISAVLGGGDLGIWVYIMVYGWNGVLGFGIMQGGGGWAWTRDQGGEDGLEG